MSAFDFDLKAFDFPGLLSQNLQQGWRLAE